MCTVTWTARPGAYDLVVNRDERRTRAPGLPPRVLSANGTRALAPIDGEAGGTWVGVAAGGLGLALLNAPRADGGGGGRSRGSLIPALLAARSPDDAIARLRALALAPFDGFRLLALAPDAPARLVGWDGARLRVEVAEPPLVSSTPEPERARAARAALLDARRAPDGSLTPDDLYAVHTSHEPERGPLSPCMHRREAATVSLTHVAVDAERVSLRATAGPPCTHALGPPLFLSRLRADARWEPHRTADGSWTLRDPESGEGAHADFGAWTEARERMARAARLGPRPTRLLDVGTGLGLNLAAALEACAGARLDVLTLELEPAVIERAIALYADAGPGPFAPHVAAAHAALAAALAREGRPVPLAGGGSLTLVLGDARTTLPARPAGERFDAVFLDPFSPRVAPGLWDERFLSEVAARLADGGLLTTYSAATAVRAALVRAGLEVGRGPRVGTKAEGTLAGRGIPLPPLEPAAARRLARAAGVEKRPGGRERPPSAP